ncbi:MAG TPA: alanine racemase, partial [Candidatus Limnocylindrales bacterium]|nr:alanine racemase [Candidatus Limnocylindrales bacterium]
MSRVDEILAEASLPPLTRNAWLEIDLDALAANFRLMRELAGDRAEAWPVVKADAYGHGIEMAARTFVEAGAERLCVATLDEALYLRRIGLNVPLVVLFGIPVDAVERLTEAGGIELSASDETAAQRLLEGWRSLVGRLDADSDLQVHLEVETGLGRGGV